MATIHRCLNKKKKKKLFSIKSVAECSVSPQCRNCAEVFKLQTLPVLNWVFNISAWGNLCAQSEHSFPAHLPRLNPPTATPLSVNRASACWAAARSLTHTEGKNTSIWVVSGAVMRMCSWNNQTCAVKGSICRRWTQQN